MNAVSDDTNPYRPPAATLVEPPIVDASAGAELYVVAPRKFLLLMVGTLGVYSVYWFYRNWSQLRGKRGSYQPVLRAIFAIFFTHALFREIEAILARKQIVHRWSPRQLASIFVAASVMDRIVTRMDGLFFSLVSLALLVPTTLSLLQAQKAINAAEEDPSGSANSALTIGNIVWLIVGLGLWTLVGVGLYAELMGL